MCQEQPTPSSSSRVESSRIHIFDSVEIISSHLISSHLISSHLISSHLISSTPSTAPSSDRCCLTSSESAETLSRTNRASLRAFTCRQHPGSTTHHNIEDQSRERVALICSWKTTNRAICPRIPALPKDDTQYPTPPAHAASPPRHRLAAAPNEKLHLDSTRHQPPLPPPDTNPHLRTRRHRLATPHPQLRRHRVAERHRHHRQGDRLEHPCAQHTCVPHACCSSLTNVT